MDEVLALEILLFVEWVVRHMRRLSFFLLLALVLTTFLISSYPYRPQELVQTISIFVFGGIAVSLVVLVGAMSRNAGLSRMTAGDPGRVTWDRTLVANLGLYGLVPLLTLIGSRSPGLRKALFDWLGPLVDFLVKT
jgi:cytochrome b561